MYLLTLHILIYKVCQIGPQYVIVLHTNFETGISYRWDNDYIKLLMFYWSFINPLLLDKMQ